MAEHIYTVVGMTCEHCVAAVTEEVERIPGAQRVEVDLERGRLAISGEGVEEADVRTAVEEAGYTLA